MKKKESVSKSMRIKILLDIAKGIEYLHSNGILHRDIKPENVLVTSLDENEVVNGKLTDFGSSRNINLLMTNMTFTKGIGTPVYMAPEILNREKYKKEADIFSFGVTMYETIKWGKCYNKEIFKMPEPYIGTTSKKILDLINILCSDVPFQEEIIFYFLKIQYLSLYYILLL